MTGQRLMCVLCLLLIQDFTIAKPVTTWPSKIDVGRDVSSPPAPPPSTSSDTPTTTPRLPDLQPSLLKTLLLHVMEDKWRNDWSREGNNSVSSLDFMSSSSTDNKSIPTKLKSQPKQDEDKMSTLTLVAIIALVVAVFISGLFIAVLCPHKVHPKILFQPCLPSNPSRHRHRRNDNFRHHHHHDANNSTATIVNESISSSSATSNQNFNINDNNSCECLKHTTNLNPYSHTEFINNSNDNWYYSLKGDNSSRIKPTFYHSQVNSDNLYSGSENQVNEIRRQNSRGSLHSNPSLSRQGDCLYLNTQESRVIGLMRQSRHSIGNQSNGCPTQPGVTISNSNTPADRINDVIKHQNPRRSVEFHEHRHVDGTTSYKPVQMPRNNSGLSENTINLKACDRNVSRCVLPSPDIQNIVIHPTESHSGGSNENANLDTTGSGIGAANTNGHRGFPERRGSFSRQSRRSSVVLTGNDVWRDDHPCPYCDVDDVQIERTWVDHENRQHSAL